MKHDFKLIIGSGTAEMYVAEYAENTVPSVSAYKRWAFVAHTHDEDFHRIISDLFSGKFPVVPALKYQAEWDTAESVLVDFGAYSTRINRSK